MKIKTLIVGSFQTNCYLLISAEEMALVDPGDEKEKILFAIEKEEKKLKFIIYTHSHFDHITAGNDIRLAKNTESLIHSAEKELFSDLEIDRFLKNNDVLKIGDEKLKVIHTPGHTPGGICLLGDDFIITGDTLFENGYGRTDLQGGSQYDIEKSLKKIDSLLKPNMIIYPGHGKSF